MRLYGIGQQQDIEREREELLLVSVLEQITLWQRRKERERLYCGTGYGQFCVFSLDLATSCRYARASLDDATDYATSLGVVACFFIGRNRGPQ